MPMVTVAPAMVERTGWLRSRLLAERYAWIVVGYNVLVIVWGAMVRATGSGAGCGNHWPLCNGQVIPLAPTLHTVIEFTHRSMTGGAALAVGALLLLTFRSTVKGQAARGAAVLSGVLLLNEALLGALLVKLGYVTDNRSVGRVVVLAIHLSNTLLLLGALTMTARLLGTGQRWVEMRASTLAERGLRVWAVVGLLSTLLVGVSGSLAALGDTLFPSVSLRSAVAQDFAAGAPWLLRLRWVHPVSAVMAGLFVVSLLVKASGKDNRRVARLVGLLLMAQFVLGVADVLLLAPVWLQLLHLLGADLFWVSLVLLSAIAVWPRRSRDAATQSWEGIAAQ